VTAECAAASPESSVLELRIEDAGVDGCMAHVTALPGLCFRARTVGDLMKAAPARIEEYARWLEAERLCDLTSATRKLTQQVDTGEGIHSRIVVSERVAGAPVWESGNAAVLFDHDLRPLPDDDVRAHLRFVRRALGWIREAVEPLSLEARRRRPAPDRRSIDETLEHVGNCVWWYGSRIDDDLPEPEEFPDEDPLDRIDRLFESAEAFLLAVSDSARATIHVPKRFPTYDPAERWTHTKVCRRQAEHAWAHLCGLKQQLPGIRKE